MRKSILFAGILVFLLPVAVFAMYAEADESEGIHEPGTGLEQPELKAENKGTGQGLKAESMEVEGEDADEQESEENEVSDDAVILGAGDDTPGNKGIHEPGTGLEDPELKEENQGTGQGLENANQLKEQKGMNDNGMMSENALQRRSQVANSVQEMLRVADRVEAGLGERIRVVAQEQNQIQEQAEAGLEQIKNRNKFVRFFIGPNYGEINSVEKRLENHSEKLEELKQIKDEIVSETDVSAIQTQIQAMEQVSEELKTELQKQEEGFSLFGWLNRLFNK